MAPSKEAVQSGNGDSGQRVYARGLLLGAWRKARDTPAAAGDVKAATMPRLEAAEAVTPKLAPASPKQTPDPVSPKALKLPPSQEPGDVETANKVEVEAYLAKKKRTRSASDGLGYGATRSDGADAATTTVMLRNIPNQYTRDRLRSRFKEVGFDDKYDFVYLPGDRTSDRNMGYAFVNLRTPEDCVAFTKAFNEIDVSEILPGFNSTKVCKVSPAGVQGWQANYEKWCTAVASASPPFRQQWLPLFLDEKGEEVALADKGKREKPAPRSRGNSGSGDWTKGGNAKGAKAAAAAAAAWPPAFEPWMAAYYWPMFQMPPVAQTKGRSRTSSAADGEAAKGDEKETKATDAEAMMAKARAALDERMALQLSKLHDLQIQQQVEYYFSEENLPKDKYLRSILDDKGWVKLADLAAFPRLQGMGATVKSISAALKNSSYLSVSRDRQRVRLRDASVREKLLDAKPAKQTEKGKKNEGAKLAEKENDSPNNGGVSPKKIHQAVVSSKAALVVGKGAAKRAGAGNTKVLHDRPSMKKTKSNWRPVERPSTVASV
eukprot:TRINITY_DN20967_c0_g2_i1.p1 TRINITY_DN20967_c0_g2~~TRINITY_DN20967_c0_g2_i1.p1  ORF type:complete len:548 (+),score=162.89 TRINITY_DN20967_c0_g2_i1:95-1738(+)